MATKVDVSKDKNLGGKSSWDDCEHVAKALAKQTNLYNQYEKKMSPILERATEKLDEKHRWFGGVILGAQKFKLPAYLASSNIKYRQEAGKALITEYRGLREELKNDDDAFAYLTTFISDSFMCSKKEPVAEIAALRDKVQKTIRNYTSMNAICVIEIHPMLEKPSGAKDSEKIRKKKSKLNQGKFCIHVHAIMWGGKPRDTNRLKKSARGFECKSTKLPIHTKRIENGPEHFVTVAGYLMKPPVKGCIIDMQKRNLGKACIKSTYKGVSDDQLLRVLELLAKCPLDNLMFGVRDGAIMQRRIIQEVKAYAAKQKQVKSFDLVRVHKIFNKIYKTDVVLKGAKPAVVNFRRKDKAA